MLGVAFEMSRANTPNLWRRYLTLLLDGWRATERPPLPMAAPTFGSLDDVIEAGYGKQPIDRAGRRPSSRCQPVADASTDAAVQHE